MTMQARAVLRSREARTLGRVRRLASLPRRISHTLRRGTQVTVNTAPDGAKLAVRFGPYFVLFYSAADDEYDLLSYDGTRIIQAPAGRVKADDIPFDRCEGDVNGDLSGDRCVLSRRHVLMFETAHWAPTAGWLANSSIVSDRVRL